LKACNYGARVSVVGILQGTESKISLPDLLYHQISLRGILMESTEELWAFVRALEASRIIPYVDKVFPFREVRDAYEYVAAQKHVGKVVIDLKP
jgi:NADPH:quinone reductase-like Zn-dependent oxidoreductase